MAPLGILVKSYRNDLAYAARLMESLDKYNVNQIPTWIVVPDADLPLFAKFERAHRKTLGESLFAQYLVTEPIRGLRAGYANQEIVKLAFWELGLVDNYFTVDSDAVFVRDFDQTDLMFNDTTPYTVLVSDNDLKVDPDYFTRYWTTREASLKVIQAEIGFDDPRLLTCHGHQIMSAEVLRSLRDEFMEPRGWTYRDMLAVSPYEFSWYNMWLQYRKCIPIYAREPFIKVLHSAEEHVQYALAGITFEDVARGYLGIVVNSNFARTWGDDVKADEDPATTLARYLPWKQLLRSIHMKARTAIRSRLTTQT